eukprot:57243_1
MTHAFSANNINVNNNNNGNGIHNMIISDPNELYNDKNNNDNKSDDAEITPQEYEQLSLFYNRMGDKRQSSQNYNDNTQQQRHSHRSSKHKLEMYKNTILESIDNSNDNHNNNNILLVSPKNDDLNLDTNDIEHVERNVFVQNQTMGKAMTDLFVTNQMNQPIKKGKKGIKNNINPMKEYHASKVLNQLETHFGSSANIQLTPNPNNNNSKKK